MNKESDKRRIKHYFWGDSEGNHTVREDDALSVKHEFVKVNGPDQLYYQTDCQTILYTLFGTISFYTDGKLTDIPCGKGIVIPAGTHYLVANNTRDKIEFLSIEHAGFNAGPQCSLTTFNAENLSVYALLQKYRYCADQKLDVD